MKYSLPPFRLPLTFTLVQTYTYMYIHTIREANRSNWSSLMILWLSLSSLEHITSVPLSLFTVDSPDHLASQSDYLITPKPSQHRSLWWRTERYILVCGRAPVFRIQRSLQPARADGGKQRIRKWYCLNPTFLSPSISSNTVEEDEFYGLKHYDLPKWGQRTLMTVMHKHSGCRDAEV